MPNWWDVRSISPSTTCQRRCPRRWAPRCARNAIRKKNSALDIEYLKEIQAGRVIPDIPTVMGPDGEEDFHNPIRYGSAARNEYIW